MKKRCQTCKRTKEDGLYNLDGNSADGLASKCRNCTNRYRAQNADRVRENWRRWRDKNQNLERLRHRIYHENNLEQRREQTRLYARKNKETMNKRAKEYRAKNLKKVAEANKVYQITNARRIAEKKKERRKNRATDLRLRQVDLVQAAVSGALSSRQIKKEVPVEVILGCSIQEFCGYIERQHREQMSWENYGITWFLGRVCPLSQALNKDEFLKLNHFSNFFPVLYRDRAALIQEGAAEADQYCQDLLGRGLIADPEPSLKKRKILKKVTAADFIKTPTRSNFRQRSGGGSNARH